MKVMPTPDAVPELTTVVSVESEYVVSQGCPGETGAVTEKAHWPLENDVKGLPDTEPTSQIAEYDMALISLSANFDSSPTTTEGLVSPLMLLSPDKAPQLTFQFFATKVQPPPFEVMSQYADTSLPPTCSVYTPVGEPGFC